MDNACLAFAYRLRDSQSIAYLSDPYRTGILHAPKCTGAGSGKAVPFDRYPGGVAPVRGVMYCS